MSAADLETFLKALTAVKSDYTCGVCNQLCKDPVTLSKCFHIICSEHFTKIKHCPTCNTSLEDCSVFNDDRLVSCVESAKQLDKMFETYKKDVIKPKKAVKHKPESTKAAEKEVVLTDKTNQTKKSKSNANLSMFSTGSKFNKTMEKKNNKGETMLHVACRLGKFDQVKELLNEGANSNTKDNAGWTPLHEVVQNGRLDLVNLLLQYNTLINVPGQSNETPLHEAVRFKQYEIAETLVKNGADLNARNCKGETPLQLADAQMKNVLLKAADNIIQTQSVNITHISEMYTELDFEEIRVYCVSSFRTVHNKLKTVAKSNNNLYIEAKFTKKATHIIVDADDNGVCQSSVDVLQAVVNSLWVLTSDWVIKSSENNLEPFEKYEVTGIGTKTYQGPKNSRYNKYKQLPGIFDGCHFYLHNFNTKYEITKTVVVTKPILTKLITDAGGIVLRRVPNPELIPEQEKLVPYHAKKGGKLVNCSHYIIFKDMYEPMYNMQHLKALPIGWLIECLEKYELCEPW